MTDRPTIFFATIAAGGGHVATARAMAEAIEASYPGAFHTIVSDYMKDLGFVTQDQRHKELWRWMLAHPWSARWGQRLLDALPGPTRAYHRRMLDGVARAAARHLAELSPALVVTNHGWLTVALTRSQTRYGLRLPVVSFATEPFDASALWAEPEAEQFIAPSKATRNDLVRMGVPSHRIDVAGYPIQQAFLHAPSQQQARHALGLEDRFTCLISLGGEGVSTAPVVYASALLTMPRSPQVIVIAGRNETLRERLEPLAQRHTSLHVRGFVNDMHRYLAACDVVIGKAGPASVMEALAVGRPVLVTMYAGLNERKVLTFLQDHALGAYVTTPEALVAAVGQYWREPERLERIHQRVGVPDFGGMTAEMAHYLVAYAQTRRPPKRQPPTMSSARHGRGL
jgi:UDP-N-acetylglucosamine:LPS N-acetylglucosamine transferase